MALKYDGIPDMTQPNMILYFKQHARQNGQS